MHVEIESVIIYSLIVSISNAFSIKSRGNPLGIEFGPAPSPADGPPLSAHALRNPIYLPAEIGGIIGAYVLIASTALAALWTIGKRLRREKALTRRPADVEMLGALQYQNQASDAYPSHFQNENICVAANIYPSPITPISTCTTTKNFSWPSPEKTDRNPYIYPSAKNEVAASVGSNPSVDIRVVQQDREYLQRGLEDIYAHVMAQEEAKAAGVELPPPPMPTYQQRPLQLIPNPAPQRLSKKNEKSRPSNLDVEGSKKSQSRASSFISSLKSPRKKNPRELQISSPIPTPLSSTFPANYASDEEPLSPRYYAPPPPPPVPTDQIPYTHSRTNSTDPSPVSPTRSIAEQLSTVNNNGMAFQHRLNPSQSSLAGSSIRQGSTRTTPQPIQVSQTQALPARNPLAGNPLPALKTQNASASNSTRTLPFRAFDPPPGLSSPSFSHTTKTTVLERTTPLSPGLRTPWTAGATPYSPYQPQTPLIPVTPRLVTKEDRKRQKKQEKHVPVMELIKSDDEMWDSGY